MPYPSATARSASAAASSGSSAASTRARPHERGNEALEVRGCLRLRDRLLVGRAGERPVAALAVDLAELLERVRDHPRAEPAIDLARVLEVGDRFLEAAELRPRLSAIRERERPEGGEAGEVGEPKAEVELGDRLLVRAFLEVARAAVRADADELEHVARAIGVVERAQVVGVVGVSVALERGEHREHGVRGRERLRIAGGRRDLERTLARPPGTRRSPSGASAPLARHARSSATSRGAPSSPARS